MRVTMKEYGFFKDLDRIFPRSSSIFVALGTIPYTERIN